MISLHSLLVIFWKKESEWDSRYILEVDLPIFYLDKEEI